MSLDPGVGLVFIRATLHSLISEVLKVSSRKNTQEPWIAWIYGAVALQSKRAILQKQSYFSTAITLECDF